SVRLSAMTAIGGGGRVGSRLGSYRGLGGLAAGAYAVVYRVIHGGMGGERGGQVKRPPPAPSRGEPGRPPREARAAARLKHPNVLSVFDFARASDGTPSLVMEYVAGCSLAQRLREGVPPACETLHIARHVAAALDYAHGRGVVHGDVKPANVL